MEALILIFITIGILTMGTLSDVKLKGGRTNDHALLLVCCTDGWYLRRAYWKRNDTLVGNTNNFWRDYIYEKDLRNGVKTQTFFRTHVIKINSNLDSNVASDWSCADDIDGPFTDPVSFASSFSETTVAPITVLSGNLTIDVFPDVQTESQLMTLTCSSDTQLGYWETMWIRNGHPVFYTSSNSTLIAHKNVTVSNVTFYFENVTVGANERQQNVTFLVTREIVENSNWSCQSDSISGQTFMLNFPEGSAIKHVDLPSKRQKIGEKEVRQDERTDEKGVISEIKTIELPSLREDDDSLPLFIGSAAGGMLVVVTIIFIIALIVKKRQGNNKTKGQIWTSQNSGLHPQRNLSLVTRENSLYESTTDGLLDKKSDEECEVMVDNILYSSSFKEETHQSDVYLTAV